jgi:hypothetical protein
MFILLAYPKSAIFRVKSVSTSIFSGFKSQCTIPHLWMYSILSISYLANIRPISSPNPLVRTHKSNKQVSMYSIIIYIIFVYLQPDTFIYVPESP